MKCWVLQLNDMRSSNIEILMACARASTRAELDAFIAKEMVEPYRDGQWGKTFRQGGPLEWFNPPWSFQNEDHFVEVDVERRVQQVRSDLESQLAQLPEAT